MFKWSWALTTALLILHASAGFAADAIPGEQWCDRVVDDIRFVGNKVTRSQVIRRELVQKAGKICSLDDIIDGIQNTQDLGLFKSVRVELRLSEDKLVLSYIVKEKVFFLPIPRFSRTSDGELRLGAQLRWDNFLGRLHQLKITTEKRQENDGQGRTGYIYSVDYTVPRFFDSRYGMSVSVARERRNVELAQDGVVFGEALRQSKQLTWSLSRWVNASDGVQGLTYFMGVGFEQRNHELRTGQVGPFKDGQDISLIAGVDVRRVHQDSYRRRGYHHSAALRVADEVLGADFSYVRVDMKMRWYLPLERRQTNVNVQLRIGLSTHSAFGEHTFGIGGGGLLRGMRTGTETGNILTLANIEYLSGLFSYPAWRWLVFTDIGNVYTDNKVNLFKQYLRAGVGLRWKLVWLTNTDIRLDVAWDPSRRKVTPYVSTSLTF